MKNYKQIRSVCRDNSALAGPVIDDFLIYFAAGQSKLEREIDRQLALFRHITRKMPKEWLNMMKSQYIAHRIFKKHGLIHKFLNHSGLKHLTQEETAFLESHAATPWRYSFSRMVDKPSPDFFEMEDIFTGNTYLLFSPGMTSIEQVQQPIIWLNLIGYNGECWQTYGPILHFNGFEPEDILFFAREAGGGWCETGEEAAGAVEENPVPFSMLISGSNLPLIFHGEYQIVNIIAEYEVEEAFDSSIFRDDFLIEYSHGVYKLSLNEWGEFPHYSSAFFDEEKRLLTLSAMTDAGFRRLVDVLNRLGYTLEYEPDERVNMGMKNTASDILKKKLQLTPYDGLFATDTPPEKQEGLDRMNALLAELMPAINNRETPDLAALAAKYGVNPGDVKEIYEMVKKKVE